MSTHLPSRAARWAAPAAIAVGALVIAPAGGVTATSPTATSPVATSPIGPPVVPRPYSLGINDFLGLPGQDKPDQVYAYTWFPDTVSVAVERGGKVIAGGAQASSVVQLADLRGGDVIVVRSSYPNWLNVQYPTYPGYPGYPNESRYVYQPRPALDARVCAGAASYTGTVNAGAKASTYAQATLWKADATKTGSGTIPYPWVSPPYPESVYPGWYPGFAVADAAQLDLKATDGDRFTLVPRKPLVAGMHLRFGESGRGSGPFLVYTDREQLVEDCAPTPSPTVTAQPTATPLVTPAPTPTPDKTAPKGKVVAPSVKELKKLGAKQLLKGGVPLTITVNEPAQLKGTISLLGVKKPVRANVSIGVKSGTSTIKVLVPNALRKAVKKVSAKKSLKLQLKLSLTDGAGNTSPLKTITIKLPKN